MDGIRRQFAFDSGRAQGLASRLRVGEEVKVRSRAEILATLDENGCLDGMPFMPEMLAYCGKTLKVFKRAHKTCDTIHYTGNRSIENAVLLQTRCDGSAHGGCEAACELFWKEAWLEAVDGSAPVPAPQAGGGCTEAQLFAATQCGSDPEKGPRYACQITQLLNASKPMSAYDPKQYITDYRSGNVSLWTLFHGAVYRVGMMVIRRADRWGRRLGLGDSPAKALMACYDGLQKLLPGGVPFPRRTGTVPPGQSTPNVGIGNLGPGSRVRVKPYSEILATLDSNNKTRGMYFDAEHVPYCGKELSVRSLVNQIVDESTGYMLRFKSPSIILENAYCQGTRSDNRMFCPRSIYPYWRTVWLTPVEQGSSVAAGECPMKKRA